MSERDRRPEILAALHALRMILSRLEAHRDGVQQNGRAHRGT